MRQLTNILNGAFLRIGGAEARGLGVFCLLILLLVIAYA